MSERKEDVQEIGTVIDDGDALDNAGLASENAHPGDDAFH